MQRQIRQLETNYRCRAFDLSLATFVFDLSLFNFSSSSSSSFDLSLFNFSFSFSDLFSSFDLSSSFDFSSSSFDSFSFDLFAFVLSIEDLLARDLLIDQRVDSNNSLIDSNCNRNRSTMFFSQIFALLRRTIRILILKKRYENRIS